ncbi:MAG: transposase [Candidatus Gracilibacteria bacterium]|nr:transposase [Candidatus Gracilibacteria bacterium]
MGRGNARDPFVENGYYHIYNRGYNKSVIFNNKDCFVKFYKYLIALINEYKDIKVVSYCLLPNHFHFIIHNNGGTGTQISMFMKRLQGAYSVWHRTKYPLENKLPFFEGRFKAKYIGDEAYLYQCIAYVNFNPLKHQLVKDIKDYPYTSYHQLTTEKEKVNQYKDMILDELEF